MYVDFRYLARLQLELARRMSSVRGFFTAIKVVYLATAIKVVYLADPRILHGTRA